jgi:outer membrane protein assembly factor BamB
MIACIPPIASPTFPLGFAMPCLCRFGSPVRDFGVLFAGVLWGLLGAAEVIAEDWPQFLGPHGTGHSTEKGLPETWNETTNIGWKSAIPGKGWSSPALVQGKLYLTTAAPIEGSDDLSLRVLTLDAKTGGELWNVELFRQDAKAAPKIHTKNSHASPSPIVDAGKVYVHFGHQGTACVDLSGNVLWKTSDIKYPPVHGNGCSPILVNGLLIFSCDGAKDPRVVALDAASGKVQWTFLREPTESKRTFAFCTSTLIEHQGKKQVVSVGAGVVHGLDPTSGKALWRVAHPGYSVIPKPQYGHGLVFISSSYDSPEVLAIKPEGTGDITDTHVAWSLKKGGPHTPSMLLIGEELYMISDRGVATCVDAKTGETHWSERVGGNFSSSLIYADGKLYFQAEDGAMTCIKPGKTFEKLADGGIKERTLASYAVGDGAIFVRTESNLYRVQKAQ